MQDFYDEWALEEREHYRGLFIKALHHLTQTLKTSGEYARAIPVAEKILALDSVDERAHQQLIFCHGMLYTCLSRVGGWECISVWSDAESGYAVLNNVVRPHVVAHLRNVP